MGAQQGPLGSAWLLEGRCRLGSSGRRRACRAWVLRRRFLTSAEGNPGNDPGSPGFPVTARAIRAPSQIVPAQPQLPDSRARGLGRTFECPGAPRGLPIWAAWPAFPILPRAREQSGLEGAASHGGPVGECDRDRLGPMSRKWCWALHPEPGDEKPGVRGRPCPLPQATSSQTYSSDLGQPHHLTRRWAPRLPVSDSPAFMQNSDLLKMD